MAIPRRIIFIAAGAAAAGAFLYVRNKLDAKKRDERYKDRDSRTERPSPKGPSEVANDDDRSADRDGMTGGVRELSEFLAGDSWFDEPGWKGIWQREGIEDASSWLKGDGLDVLKSERNKLEDHPALLAGCRRRWIVVARYGGIDVGDAAALWNEVDG